VFKNEFASVSGRAPSAGQVNEVCIITSNNGVHQDRLVKKLRRKGIQSYEATNEYLEADYLPEHHQRFARAAARPENYHVRTPSAARLREVFRLETERWISNDWVVQYRGHFSAAQAAESAVRTDPEQGIDQ
jgi:tRNA G18 (ribose-2'-O)-methylase SpoU